MSSEFPSRTTWAAALAIGLYSGAAHATQQGRDLNGSAGRFEAYYDTVLNITWLANANMHDLMSWAAANTRAANFSFTDDVNVYDNWHLAATTDTGTPGAKCTYNGTDCGYNVAPTRSEMTHLYFVAQGNQRYYTTTRAESGAYAGGRNSNSTLDNTCSFTSFQSDYYWSGTEYAPDPHYAWFFGTRFGNQVNYDQADSFYALAVSLGDVATVPEALTYALMLALGRVGWAVQRRKV